MKNVIIVENLIKAGKVKIVGNIKNGGNVGSVANARRREVPVLWLLGEAGEGSFEDRSQEQDYRQQGERMMEIVAHPAPYSLP